MDSKSHAFQVDFAVKYGVPKAILIANLRFWLAINKAHERNIHDGYCWTYNSASEFGELFPYFKPNSIGKWLRELEEDGVLLSGNYNKSAYDHTKWYTIPDEFSVD
ncbi:MAG: hypothetical protein RPT25_15420 [Cycloclasticus sp.]|jgi:hypothetical protein